MTSHFGQSLLSPTTTIPVEPGSHARPILPREPPHSRYIQVPPTQQQRKEWAELSRDAPAPAPSLHSDQGKAASSLSTASDQTSAEKAWWPKNSPPHPLPQIPAQFLSVPNDAHTTHSTASSGPMFSGYQSSFGSSTAGRSVSSIFVTKPSSDPARD